MTLLSLIPIVLILVLMVGWQWSAFRAGAAGYLSALVVAVLFFNTGPLVLAYAHARAAFLIVDVLLIIWGAFLFYRVVDEAGGIKVLGEVLPRLTGERGMQALLIGWAFASFLQGVGGFGVPVAVIAPLLVGLGFSPLSAVVIPSIGHSWAVTFGSLGSSFNAMMVATGMAWDVLAGPAALFLGAACFGAGALVAHTAGSWSTVRKLLVPILVMGGLMAAAQYAAAVWGLWNIGGFLGGSVGIAAGVVFAWWRNRKSTLEEPLPVTRRHLFTALSPYLVLIVLTLVVQLIAPLREILGRWVIGVDFPETTTGAGFVVPAGRGREIIPLRHAGMILALSALGAYLTFFASGWYQPGAVKRVFSSLVTRLISSSVGIVAMVMMAVIMQHAGMTDQLARGISQTAGKFFPFLSPWLGALGAFMTGSNTNSNLVFSLLQMRTAEVLGFPAALILAAQTAGGALGSVIAPTKVIVGASTAGMAGKEGEVMRRLLPPMGILILFVSLLTGWGVYLR